LEEAQTKLTERDETAQNQISTSTKQLAEKLESLDTSKLANEVRAQRKKSKIAPEDIDLLIELIPSFLG